MKLTEKQLEQIVKEANKEIHKRFPLLHDPVKKWMVIRVLEAYEKVMK
jgi:hypothetical protein